MIDGKSVRKQGSRGGWRNAMGGAEAPASPRMDISAVRELILLVPAHSVREATSRRGGETKHRATSSMQGEAWP